MRTVEKIARRRIFEADDALGRAAEREASSVVQDDPSASPAEQRAIRARRQLYLEWLLNPDSAVESYLKRASLSPEVNSLLQQYITNHGEQLERALQSRLSAPKNTSELDAALAAKNRIDIVSKDKIETGTSGLSAEDFVGYLGLTLAQSGKMGTLSSSELRPVIDEMRASDPKFNAAFSWLLGVQPARGFPKTRSGGEVSPEDYYSSVVARTAGKLRSADASSRILPGYSAVLPDAPEAPPAEVPPSPEEEAKRASLRRLGKEAAASVTGIARPRESERIRGTVLTGGSQTSPAVKSDAITSVGTYAGSIGNIDPLMSDRSTFVSSLRVAMQLEDDPMAVLNNALYKSQSFMAGAPMTVGPKIVQDMVVNSRVKDMLGYTNAQFLTRLAKVPAQYRVSGAEMAQSSTARMTTTMTGAEPRSQSLFSYASAGEVDDILTGAAELDIDSWAKFYHPSVFERGIRSIRDLEQTREQTYDRIRREFEGMEPEARLAKFKRDVGAARKDQESSARDRILRAITTMSVTGGELPLTAGKQSLEVDRLTGETMPVVTPAAMRRAKGNLSSASISRNDAANFAIALKEAYTRISQDEKAGDDESHEAAQEVFDGASQTVRDALAALGRALVDNTGETAAAVHLIKLRIDSEGKNLRPYMTAAADAQRKIQLVYYNKYNSPHPAFRTEMTDVSTPRGRKSVETIRASSGQAGMLIKIPSKYLQPEGTKRDEATDALIFEQASASQQLLTILRGCLYVAKADVILNMRDEVEKSSRIDEKSRASALSALDDLQAVVKDHPYGSLSGADTVDRAREMMLSSMQSSQLMDLSGLKSPGGEAKPPRPFESKSALFSLSDESRRRIAVIASTEPSSALVKTLIDAVKVIASASQMGGKVERSAIEAIIKASSAVPTVAYMRLDPGLLLKKDLQRALKEVPEKQIIIAGPGGEVPMEAAPEVTSGGFEVTGPEGERLTELTNLPIENERLSLALDSLLDPKMGEAESRVRQSVINDASMVGLGAGPKDAGVKDPGRATPGRIGMAAMIRQMSEDKHPAVILARVLGLKGDRTLASHVETQVQPLKRVEKDVKERQAEAAALMYRIVDNADEKEGIALKRAAIMKSIQVTPGDNVARSMTNIVNARSRIAQALSSANTPAEIFLTPRNMTLGALQLLIERNVTAGEVPSMGRVNPLNPYAIPNGPIVGDTKQKSRETNREYVDRISDRMPGHYVLPVMKKTQSGVEVVIPSMMLVNDVDRNGRSLTLGLGRVVTTQTYRKSVTSRDLTRYGLNPADDKIQDKFLKGIGPVNLMGVTVTFPAGQWKLNGVSYWAEQIDQYQARNAEIAGLIDALREKGEERNAKEIDELLKEANQNAAHIARYPTDEQIINAITATDPSASLLSDRIATLDRQTGALTLTRVCPAFLDLASAHRSDLSANWGRALFNVIVSPATVMNLPTKVGMMGEVTSKSVPTSALQFPASHEGIVVSPFNVNQRSGAGFGVKYSVGGGKELTVNISGSPEVERPEETLARVMGRVQARLVKRYPSARSSTISRFNIVKTQNSTGFAVYPAPYAGPVSEGLDQYESDLNQAASFILMSDQVFDMYTRGPNTEISEGTAGLPPELRSVAQNSRSPIYGMPVATFRLREDRRDDLRRIRSVKLAGSNFPIEVGALVYLRPQYQGVIPDNAANRSLPTDLCGIGEVKRIYYSEQSFSNTGDDAFRALLVDIEFRGDQMKSGVRGTASSPSRTLRGFGVAFVQAVDPQAFGRLRPGFRLAKGQSMLPDDANYRAVLRDHPIFKAGWFTESSQDASINRTPDVAEGSRLIVGEDAKIIQAGHPRAGETGVLLGFASARDAGLSNVDPDSVGAVMQVGSGGVVMKIVERLREARQQLVGIPVPDSSLETLFNHIDTDIIHRYLEAAKSKREKGTPFKPFGFHSFAAGTLVAGSTNPDFVGMQSTTSEITGETKDATHGAGAWEGAHAEGIALHPGDPVFAKLTGRGAGKGVRVTAKPSSHTVSLLGCSSVMKAILKHGPEATLTAEEYYKREEANYSKATSVNVAGGESNKDKSEYPPGTLTSNAISFNQYTRQWAVRGGGRSGRTTGATSGAVGVLSTNTPGFRRLGSPIGSSFRFQISEAEGLAYTKMLRDEMGIVKDRAYNMLDAMRAEIKGSANARAEDLDEATRIVDTFEREICMRIKDGIEQVQSLGYRDEKTGIIMNSLEAYKSNKAYAEQRFEVRPVHAVSEQIESTISGVIEEIDRIANTSVWSQVPVPTKQEIRVDVTSLPSDTGEAKTRARSVTVVLGEPRPAASGGKAALELYLTAPTEAAQKLARALSGKDLSSNAAERAIAQGVRQGVAHRLESLTGNPNTWSNVAMDMSIASAFDPHSFSNIEDSFGISAPGVEMINVDAKAVMAASNDFMKKLGAIVEEMTTIMSGAIKELEAEAADLADNDDTSGAAAIRDTVNLLSQLIATAKRITGPGWLAESEHNLVGMRHGVTAQPDGFDAARATLRLMRVCDSAMGHLAVIRDEGQFKARFPDESLSIEAQEAAKEKQSDIASSNERYQLANVRTFPSENAVRQMIVSMDNMLNDAREPDLVGVPIVASSNDSAAKLIGLPSGTKLNGQEVNRLLDGDIAAARDLLNALGRALAKTA
jgi:hypothetical protein